MSNGDTIDSIERILTGQDDLPERVSNTLLLAAIRANYQNVSCIKDELHDLEIKQIQQESDIGDLKKRSDRNDIINSVAVAIAGALGIAFGKQ